MSNTFSVFSNLDHLKTAEDLLKQQAELDRKCQACAALLLSSCCEVDLIEVLDLVIQQGHSHTKQEAQNLRQKILEGMRLELQELCSIDMIYNINQSLFREE